MKRRLFLPALVLPLISPLFAAEPVSQKPAGLSPDPDLVEIPEHASVATFGAGCFWCSEEIFHQIPGVYSVVSGYMGGRAEDADYESVSTGRTQHAEVVQIHFDPATLKFDELIDRFFASHDPTLLNAQGPDRGPQYRSVIFFHDDMQHKVAREKIRLLNESKVYTNPIVTEISAAKVFFPAEDYHQNFARKNPDHRYLESHLYPKMEELKLQIPAGGESRNIFERFFLP